MTESARAKLDAIRLSLEKELKKTRTHFGMHMVYIVAFGELEDFARDMARELDDKVDG